MGSKRKSGEALRKVGPFKLRDLKEGIRLDLWSVPDPPKTYEANACDVLIEARELVFVFGQNPPGISRPLTAISIGIPADEAPPQIDAFSDIRTRLARLNFADSEEESRRIDRKHLIELTERTYTRFSAQYIRAGSGDSIATLDFYKRPAVTLEVIKARPDDVFQLVPAVRVSCPTLVLSLMLRLVDEVLKE